MIYEAESEKMVLTPGQEAELRKVTIERAQKDFAAFNPALSDDDAFAHLPQAAIAAYHLDYFDDAKVWAERALLLAPSFRKNWNYGNALHLGHTVLGLLALRAGDVAAAIEELHRSGDTPGSPQLNSFGPTMQLAKELQRIGESEAVLTYLAQCRKFWKMGKTWLKLWEPMVRSGKVPNCFQHSYG